MKYLDILAKVLPFLLGNPQRMTAAIAGLALMVFGAILLLWSLWPLMGKSEDSAEPPAPVVVTNSSFGGPTQIGGQGNTLNVNQPAYFESQAQVQTKEERGAEHPHLLRITVPIAPGGMWQAGTEMAFRFRLNRPCNRWALGGNAFGLGIMNARFGARENTDVIAFATTNPPRPGEPVVFEADGDQPMQVVSASWSPVASS